MTQIDYPFHFGSGGRTAQAEEEKHIRDLIEQVLFTTPGERVNCPTFGSGLMALVFEPNSDELVTTTQFLVQGALQQWLGHLIQVEEVKVESKEATLLVDVKYVIKRDQQRHEARFTSGGM